MPVRLGVGERGLAVRALTGPGGDDLLFGMVRAVPRWPAASHSCRPEIISVMSQTPYTEQLPHPRNGARQSLCILQICSESVRKGGVDIVNGFGAGLGRISAGLGRIAYIFWSSLCFQGRNSGSSPTSGTFSHVRGPFGPLTVSTLCPGWLGPVSSPSFVVMISRFVRPESFLSSAWPAFCSSIGSWLPHAKTT